MTDNQKISSEQKPASENLMQDVQTRVWGALKKGYEYAGLVDASDAFLRNNVFSRVNMIVLYVDLVGSTKMSLELPEDKLAIIISSFAQEMAYVITHHNGFVLKFVGDAVIGYFIADKSNTHVANDAVDCANSMIRVIEDGINPILNQYDYPDLSIKIGMDYGENIIVRYGADEKESHVDILGPPMSIAAKIQDLAKPNQILVGDDVYTRISPDWKNLFKPIVWQNEEWSYRSRITGDIYRIYEYLG